MNIKITNKDGVTLKTANKYVGEDIAISLDESLLGSNGLPLEVDSLPSGGTAVPNSGYVENVYFNTALSTEEVVGILSTLDYGEYGVYYGLGVSERIGLMFVINEGIYGIANELADEYYFISSDVGVGIVGWNPNFNGIIEVNNEVSSELNGLPIGTQNDKLTNLFSITPFGGSAGVEGAIYKVGSGATGTAVPNSGVVEKIYFNTSKTMEEVVSILEQLTYTQTNLMVNPLCPVLFASDGNPVVFIGQLTRDDGTLTGGYCISIVTDMANSVFTNAFNYNNGTTQDGWLLDNYNVNKNVISEYNGLPIGTQNELIKDIISITPFSGGESDYYLCENGEFIEMVMPEGTLEITEKGEYDVKELEKVNVNIESGSGEDMLQARVDATNSCHYLFYYYNGSNVNFISGLDTSSVTNMNSMFYNCSNLTTIPQLKTSNVTNMANMFASCTNLTSVPQLDTSSCTNMGSMFNTCSSLTTIPQLDTSNVTNMYKIFEKCSNLTTIPQLDTSSCTNMSNMFYGCSILTSVPQLNTSSCTNMAYMFYNCNALETIDITYYNISSTSYTTNFAYNCAALKALIIRGFGTNYAINANSFTDSGIASGIGYIYVPRSMVDTLKSATNWSTYANQIRALEDYTIDGTTTGALDETKI